MFIWVCALLAVIQLIFRWLKGVQCPCENRIDGKVAVVTGASTGVGFKTALLLAQKGARVIALCRDMSKAEGLLQQLKRISNQNEMVHLDLNSMKEVKKCSDRIHQLTSQVDILINNAGVMAGHQKFTEDGLQNCLQSNYFGHFYLTFLLLDLIKNSSFPRIVNLCSIAHRVNLSSLSKVQLNLDTIYPGKVPFSTGYYYSQSKLFVLLFTKQLAARLTRKGIKSLVVALHPGIVITDIMRETIPSYKNWPLVKYMFKSWEEGAQTSLYLSLEDSSRLQNGGYYDDCHRSEEHQIAHSQAHREQLWSMTEGLLGFQFNI